MDWARISPPSVPPGSDTHAPAPLPQGTVPPSPPPVPLACARPVHTPVCSTPAAQSSPLQSHPALFPHRSNRSYLRWVRIDSTIFPLPYPDRSPPLIPAAVLPQPSSPPASPPSPLPSAPTPPLPKVPCSTIALSRRAAGWRVAAHCPPSPPSLPNSAVQTTRMWKDRNRSMSTPALHSAPLRYIPPSPNGSNSPRCRDGSPPPWAAPWIQTCRSPTPNSPHPSPPLNSPRSARQSLPSLLPNPTTVPHGGRWLDLE